jgi:enoyl-CoA hydratase/carnithine racemase
MILHFKGNSATHGPDVVSLRHSVENLPIPEESWMQQHLKMTKDTEFQLYNIIMEGVGENRFTIDLMQGFHAALDYVQASQEELGNPPAAIVTTSNDSKLWSNGLNLQQAGQFGVKYMRAYANLLRRMLGDDIHDEMDPIVDGQPGKVRRGVIVPTVACIQGHAFAGGCLLSLVHDYRTMRNDKGWMCMNEIDMPAPMPAGLLQVIQTKLPQLMRKVMLEGYRFTGEEALANGMVDALGKDGEDSWKQAVSIAGKWAPKARAGPYYGQIKRECWSKAVETLSRESGYTVLAKSRL